MLIYNNVNILKNRGKKSCQKRERREYKLKTRTGFKETELGPAKLFAYASNSICPFFFSSTEHSTWTIKSLAAHMITALPEISILSQYGAPSSQPVGAPVRQLRSVISTEHATNVRARALESRRETTKLLGGS
jgi:hypothetical protein